jgi:uncharacterized membrane protein
MRFVPVIALVLGLAFSSPAAAGQSARMVLALGNIGFLNPGAIQAATGAEVMLDTGKYGLQDFAVVVLGNIAYFTLPAAIQQGLAGYVNSGGAVLLAGGAQSFGSGGYQPVASIVPFQMLPGGDWRATPFRFPVPVQAGHPILAGVRFANVGNLNDMRARPDAVEILRSLGGGPGGFPYPLIAELTAGAGRVIGIAFDLNEFAGMPDRDLFVRNTITYLLSVSRLGQGR